MTEPAMAATDSVIAKAEAVDLSYGATTALVGASIEVAPGERVALMGPSGSGKSSLLHCLAGVLAPDRGAVWFDGERLDTLRQSQRSGVRLRRMGVVFQFGNLVPELTLLDNVMLPLVLTGHRRPDARTR